MLGVWDIVIYTVRLNYRVYSCSGDRQKEIFEPPLDKDRIVIRVDHENWLRQSVEKYINAELYKDSTTVTANVYKSGNILPIMVPLKL
jgi:regulation of enolase protein 1 (concanavalin A-like superfamily)